MASLEDLYGGESFSDLALCDAQDQDAFDKQFYEAVLRLNPSNLQVLRRLVEAVGRQADYERTLELNQRILNLDARDFIAHYNMACSYAMLGEAEAGLQSLKQAIHLGYTDQAHLEADSDLDLLRSDLRYYDLIALLD
jgi:tetratricopeptide (TPR) repeat protein